MYQFILWTEATPFLYFCQTEYYNDDYIRGDMKLLLLHFEFGVEGGIINKKKFLSIYFIVPYCIFASDPERNTDWQLDRWIVEQINKIL